MQIKLMTLGLKNKYTIKDCLMVAPDSVLKKKSLLDIYALGILSVHLLFGIDCQRVQASTLAKAQENFEFR